MKKKVMMKLMIIGEKTLLELPCPQLLFSFGYLINSIWMLDAGHDVNKHEELDDIQCNG